MSTLEDLCPYCQVGITDLFLDQNGYKRKCNICGLITGVDLNTPIQITTGQVMALRNILTKAHMAMTPLGYKSLVQRWDAVIAKVIEPALDGKREAKMNDATID
jgi:hypothetical protein